VSWLGNQLGISNTVGEDPWTVAHAKWFQDQHRWGTTPKPGAIVFFSWSGGSTADDINHVGIVVKDNHDGTIQTIEGNTDGGQVESKTRDTSEVVGYGYPSYAS
jgi:surface antigen